MSNAKGAPRVLYAQLLRIFACLAVILIHTKSLGATRVLRFDPGTGEYCLSLFFTVYIRFAVPAFLAISGAFLLGRKEEPAKKQMIRIARTAAVLLIFSALYYLDGARTAGEPLSLKVFLKKVYSTNTGFILWYLYTYLAFLVSLPLLRPLAQNLSRRGFLFMFGLVLLFQSLIPCLEVLVLDGRLHFNQNFTLAWMSGYLVVYPMFGYFFHNRLDPERDVKDWWWVWPAAAAGLLLTCFTIHRMGMISGALTTKIIRAYVGKFDLLHTASVFLAIRCLCRRFEFPDILKRLIISMGSCVFGIYLIHALFMEDGRLFVKLQAFLGQRGHMNGLLATVLSSMIIMLISYGIVRVLKLIPGIRKLL